MKDLGWPSEKGMAQIDEPYDRRAPISFISDWMTALECELDSSSGSGDWVQSAFPVAGTDPLSGSELEAADDVYAAVAGASDTPSKILKCKNFDSITSNVQAGDTILGFEFRITRFRAYLNPWTIASTTIKLVKADAIVGNDIGGSFTWPDTEAAQTIGSSTELGGQTWTAAEVRSATFGCSIQPVWTAGIGTEVDPEAFIDLVEARVHGER